MTHSILVTGVAGFIGMHVAERLLARGERVVGVDNLNSYYDPALKRARLDRLLAHPSFSFTEGDISMRAWCADLFAGHPNGRVIHLAAQAGVRYSTENPSSYIDSNIVGFANVLEGCRNANISHLVYASSSSVYGGNSKLPFAETDNVDHPVSLYAATKKSNELMAHVYSHLYGIPLTGLRFFTVYGPWGRPDMAYYSFTKRILAGEPIKVYNNGNLSRDFTYIDDIVEGIVSVLDRPPEKISLPGGDASARIYNIGASTPIPLMTFIRAIERAVDRRALLEMLPMQPGDVPATFADMSELDKDVGFRPRVELEVGIERFVNWYRSYHG